MKTYKYNPNFLPLQYPGYCGVTCFMWILNYFWWTNFNARDTWDMLKIASLGRYKYNDGGYEISLVEIEFAYALHRLGFDVEIFMGLKEKDFQKVLNKSEIIGNYINPKYHRFIRWNNWIEWRFKRDVFDKYLYKKILNEKVKINFLKENHEKEIINFIRNNQWEDVLFMVWLNYNVLYDIKDVDEEYSWWHIVVCKTYKDERFEIYDPMQVKNPVFVYKDVFVKAIVDFWFYEIIMVKNGRYK